MIDAYVSVSVVGLELLVIRARIVVASVETFLRYAAAMGFYGEPGGVLQRTPTQKEIGNGRGRLQGQQGQQGQQQQLQQLLQQLQQPLQQLAQSPQQQQRQQK